MNLFFGQQWVISLAGYFKMTTPCLYVMNQCTYILLLKGHYEDNTGCFKKGIEKNFISGRFITLIQSVLNSLYSGDLEVLLDALFVIIISLKEI